MKQTKEEKQQLYKHTKIIFDDIIYNLRRFHVIRPILAKDKQDEIYLSNFLQILNNMGLSPINIDGEGTEI